MKSLNVTTFGASYSKALSKQAFRQPVVMAERLAEMPANEVDDLLKKMAIGASIGFGFGLVLLLNAYLGSGR